MNQNPVLAKVKSKFDLGYILELENGEEAQLRVIEQKGRELEYHVAGNEELIFNETIPVFIIYRDDRYCSVSQFSPAERKERQKIEQKKIIALESCEIGNVYTMEIEKDYEWGYLCREVGGYLSGAIEKPIPQVLYIGQKVVASVVGKNKNGAPYLEINGNPSNA